MRKRIYSRQLSPEQKHSISAQLTGIHHQLHAIYSVVVSEYGQAAREARRLQRLPGIVAKAKDNLSELGVI